MKKIKKKDLLKAVEEINDPSTWPTRAEFALDHTELDDLADEILKEDNPNVRTLDFM